MLLLRIGYAILMTYVLFFWGSGLTYAQNKDITIEGVVIDPATAEKLPFVNIVFLGDPIGTRSDINGAFKLKLSTWPSDTIRASMPGYTKEQFFIDTTSNYLKLKIELSRSTKQIKKLVIRYDPNKALSLIKKVIANKDNNDQNKADNYKYEVYNKLELDLTKIPKRTFSGKGFLKEFSFMSKFMDSTSETDPFLPLFLTETLSDYYFQQTPKKSKEFIKATKISGYKNESVSKFLGSMYQNINIYDNTIPIFDKRYISPISNTAPLFYKFTIVDTFMIGYDQYYKVLFAPKRKGERTFRGDLLIHHKDYAVQKVSMELAEKQQVNWVDKISIVQEFEKKEEAGWFLIKDKFFVDFTPTKIARAAGMIGRKTTTYKNIIVDDESIAQVLNNKKTKEDLIVLEGASDKDESYWNNKRHSVLSKNEKAIYTMIDTIQSLPVYNKYYNLIYFLSTGIKEVGPLEIGSIYNLFSRNVIEGSRYRLNLGTTPKLFNNAYLNGYIAYGTKDKRFKYNANLLWLLDRKPRRYIYLSYKKDVDNSVSSYDTRGGSIDNTFNNIGRKSNIPWKLLFIDSKRGEFYNETHNGFSQMLSFERKITTPYAPLPVSNIFTDANGASSQRLITSELGLELRFAYLEKFVEGNYLRTSLGTKYPAVKFYAGLGLKNVFKSDVNYFKLRLSIADNQPLGSVGKLSYNLFAGKIFGTLPYTSLAVHPGNEFYYYNAQSFNMMHRFEYISDTYAGLMLEHSLGSFIFKYIPLLRATKIRTFYNAKGVYGKLSQANQDLNLKNDFGFQTLSTAPYLELGTGVENIFRLLRVDFVWRVLPVSRINDSAHRRFGVFGSLKFEF